MRMLFFAIGVLLCNSVQAEAIANLTIDNIQARNFGHHTVHFINSVDFSAQSCDKVDIAVIDGTAAGGAAQLSVAC